MTPKNRKDGAPRRRTGFRQQLIKSHLAVSSIGLTILLSALAATYYLRAKVIVLAEEGAPIVEASSQIQAEVQHSLAGLRGWVSLGDESLLKEWQKAWELGIEPARATLLRYRKVFNKSGNSNLIRKLPHLLDELRESQWWVKSVAQTPGNEPARVSYFFEAEPVGLALDSIIASIIQQARQEGRLGQEEKIFQISDAQRYFSIARLLMEKIIFEGSLYLEAEFGDNLSQARGIIAGLPAQQKYHSRFQSRLFALFERESDAYEKMAQKAINQRKSEKWNMAQYLMATETVPLTNQILDAINTLNADSQTVMRREAQEASLTARWASAIMIGLIVIMVLAAFIVSHKRAKALNEPVTSLSEAAQALADGRLNEDIPVVSADELGELTKTFNTMRGTIQMTQDELHQANLHLEQRVKERTEALRESEERFRAIFEQAAAGIAIATPGGRFIRTNQRFCDIVGYTADEILALTFQEITHPDDLESDLKMFRQLSAGEIATYSIEKRYIRKDGSPVWIYLAVSVVPKLSGDPNYFIGVIEDINERVEGQAQIKASLAEKEVLLREIHHRVKNNMQVIISLLRLQSAGIKEKDLAGLFKESQDRIQTMSLIHEKLYQSKDFANIAFDDHVKAIVSGLVASHGIDSEKIHFSIDMAEVTITLDQAIPCGLIINELVTNAFKHAFPHDRRGEIKILLRRLKDQQVELEVNDDGIGIAAGIDLDEVNTLGLELVKTLAKHQLGGEVTLDRTNGTIFQIRFQMVGIDAT